MDTELPRSRVEAVRANLSAASQGRYPAPKLIAVTKTHPPEMILPLREMGISDIGENRVQEIEEKLPALGENFRIHLIGRLQSNKVKYIIENVCLIQSLDRLSLAAEIDRQAQKQQTQHIDEHEPAAAILAAHPREFPYVSAADGAACRQQDEAQPGTQSFSFHLILSFHFVVLNRKSFKLLP